MIFAWLVINGLTGTAAAMPLACAAAASAPANVAAAAACAAASCISCFIRSMSALCAAAIYR